MNQSSRAPSSKSARSCSWKIEQLPGLSPEDAERLKACDILTTRQLLQKTSTDRDRQQVAAALQIHIQHLNKWIALADLARVPAVGLQHCGVLLHAGIASTLQLAQMPLHRLHTLVLRFYVATLQRQDLCPPRAAMAHWIGEAQMLSHQEVP